MSEPTATRIESTVHHVLMDRLKDGQFDDCDITLRELHLIEQSVVKSLCAVHHGRIKYPKGESGRREPAAAERTETPPAADAAKEAVAVDKPDSTREVAQQA